MPGWKTKQKHFLGQKKGPFFWVSTKFRKCRLQSLCNLHIPKFVKCLPPLSLQCSRHGHKFKKLSLHTVCNLHFRKFARVYPYILKIHVFEGKIHQIQDGKNKILHLEIYNLRDLQKKWVKSPISGLQSG